MMNELTETEKAYIAGFFDGEGCISISKHQGKNNRTPVYCLNTILAQKGIDILAYILETTGVGSLNERKKYYPGTYELRISPLESVDLLKAILPYLKGKKHEAEIAIEYQSQQSHKNSGGKGWIVPQEMVDKKESYYLKLQQLKGTSGKRGRPKLQK
jgi:intein-encoded DNA endonuclease-like protein